MAMMQELHKRPGCPLSADGYHCDDRLRNQFLEYHDRSAWYGEVYTLTEDGDLKNLVSRHFLPASSTLHGVRDEYIAYLIARLEEAGELSPKEAARLNAAAEAAGGEAAELARKLLQKENTEEKGQTGTVNEFDQLAADAEFRVLVDALLEAVSPRGPNTLASAVPVDALPGPAIGVLREAGATVGDLTPAGDLTRTGTDALSRTHEDPYGKKYTSQWSRASRLASERGGEGRRSMPSKRRTVDPRGGTPASTWGEAAELRMAGQSKPLGPTGTSATPMITGGK